ncbi:TPA: hypothetical protein ACX6S8_001572 [Photobacterium damselae]
MSIDVFLNNIDKIIAFCAVVAGFVVFYMEKRINKRQAAKILIIDIRKIESTLNRLQYNKSIEVVDFKLNYGNSWEESKHLFVSDVSPDSFELITSLFAISDALKEAMELQKKVFNETLLEKARIMQQKIMSIDSNDELIHVINKVNGNTEMFLPTKPDYTVYKCMDEACTVSGTIAFEVLRKIAKMH